MRRSQLLEVLRLDVVLADVAVGGRPAASSPAGKVQARRRAWEKSREGAWALPLLRRHRPPPAAALTLGP